jgi:ribosomal protein S18 acetylase RimI-like enzyme
MHPLPTPQPACAEELAPAFRLVFRHLSAAERDARAAAALDLVARGELDPQGIFVLRGAAGLAGALVCASVPGAGGLLWPPAVADPADAAGEDLLVRHACAWLRNRGAKLGQALLGPDEEALAGPLERNGLARVTSLWYLRHDLVLSASQVATPARLHYEPYDPTRPAAFHDTLVRTYEHTLDCPEVNGARTIEEVIRGHQAQGGYDPELWWLARAKDRPVGVLLITPQPESGAWEVAYMGIVPEARRHGFGRELLLRALVEARAAQAPRVVLSVDARNQPAWQFYTGMGFEPYDRRAVYLAVWR